MWYVVTTINDKLKVVAELLTQDEYDKRKPIQKECAKYDRYVDSFKTEKEARGFIKECAK